MSNTLEEYKAAYSEYIKYAVDLHNYHQSFIKTAGQETGFAVRKALRKMRELEARMLKLSLLAYKENLANKKELRQKRREAFEKWRAENPPVKGRPKGSKNNVKHNRSNQSSS